MKLKFNYVKADRLCREFEETIPADKRISGKVNWKCVFETEQDIINALMNIYVPANRQPHTNLFIGYEYIYSFATYVQKGGTLSEKQMIQAKRLAVQIKKAEICSTCYENDIISEV